jgi:hypothetical protein
MKETRQAIVQCFGEQNICILGTKTPPEDMLDDFDENNFVNILKKEKDSIFLCD